MRFIRRGWMKEFGIIAAVLMIASCSDHHHSGEPPMDKEELRKDIELLAGKRIFFGHQSVGVDIMQGVRDLRTEIAGTGLNLVAWADSSPVPTGPFFADALVGRNSDPNSKCDAFGVTVGALAADSLDIALLKFCYVDIKDRTDVEEMFAYYVGVMERLKQTYPRVTFIHVTVPLTERGPAWKRWAKKLLGRDDVWEIASIKRAAFNAKLVEHFKNEPIFDLAKIESTYPDGSRNSYESGGNTVYMLVSAYTRDGGHLNELGRRLAARALIRTVAETIKGGMR